MSSVDDVVVYTASMNDVTRSCVGGADETNPVCKWSEWSIWSDCSDRCDLRRRNRTRHCTSVTPCPGQSVQLENCLREDCDGEYID